MSAAVEKRSNAEAVEGTGIREPRSGHPDSLSDDARRRVGWQSRSWQGSAHAIFRCPDGTQPSTTYHTRSSDSRRSARRAPYRISAPHRPLSACACASLQQQCLAWSGRVQAALARRMVPRGAGTTPVQRQVPVWAVSHVGSRDVLCRRLRIIDGGCSLGPRRGRLRASILLDPSIFRV